MTEKFISRYTTLPYLLDILFTKEITLLDPEKWEDKNDSAFIKKYKNRSNLKSVLALCFADAPENYFHWKVYSGNPSGVCIQFNREVFINLLQPIHTLKPDHVKYWELAELESALPTLDVAKYPFAKRYAFYSEEEYRIIYSNMVDEKHQIKIPITIDCINNIILSPWLQTSVFSSVVEIIHKIKGCKYLSVRKSTILDDNERWKKLAE